MLSANDAFATYACALRGDMRYTSLNKRIAVSIILKCASGVYPYDKIDVILQIGRNASVKAHSRCYEALSFPFKHAP